jgi:hypothetical protein
LLRVAVVVVEVVVLVVAQMLAALVEEAIAQVLALAEAGLLLNRLFLLP